MNEKKSNNNIQKDYKLKVTTLKKIFVIILLLICFLFFLCKVFRNIEYNFENNYEFTKLEFMYKTKLFLFNNFIGKKTNNYYNTVKNLIGLYTKQWIFDKAEYYQKQYIETVTDDKKKIIEYCILSHLLFRQKKYKEAELYLKKASEQNNNKYKFDLDEQFLLLYLSMGELDKVQSIIDKAPNTNRIYYSLLLDNVQGKNDEVKNKINYEILYSTHKPTLLISYNIPFKYLNLYTDEMYQNSLRRILLNILISEKDKEQINILFLKILKSEESIYGYYSPENLCNHYQLYTLKNNNAELFHTYIIANSLLYFQKTKKENKNLKDKIAIFCNK